MGKRNANKVRTRAYLYSPERPDKGVLFQSADAIAEALEQGWEESPGEARDAAEEAAEEAKAAEAAEAAKAAKAAQGNGNKNGGTKKVTTGDNS